MRFVICDDNSEIIEVLKKYITEYFKTKKISIPEFATYGDGTDLLQDTGRCDFLFLDVEMPGPDGIYIGQEMRKRYPHAIVFIVTAYSQYLDDAMRIQVFRYLSKPVDKQRLFRNLTDGLRKYYLQNTQLVIETREETRMVYVDEIIMAERTGRSVYIYTTSGIYRSVSPLAYWAEKLEYPCFFQTHRSYIVNLKYVTQFDRTSIVLYEGQCKAYLAARRYAAFRKAHIAYIESMR